MINRLDILDAYKDDLWNLLFICDNDFTPPLSERESSLIGPIKYFNSLFTENLIAVLAYNKRILVGFSLFYDQYNDENINIKENYTYIKIACIHPHYRGKGIASTFNDIIEVYVLDNKLPNLIIRRTWSTNYPQLKILQTKGYELFKQLENDRDNGVSTVYFRKRIIKPVAKLKWLFIQNCEILIFGKGG